MLERHVPVLIVGGSLVGLSTSVLLAARGVDNLVVERHRGTAIHPRAASFHQRTMEIFRGVGLQEEIESAAAKEFVQNGAIVAVESLAGRELAAFFTNFNQGVEDLSPTARLFITQIGLEPLLREHAESLGAELSYATELVGFEQHPDEVVAQVRPRDGGEETLVHAKYVVATDGAHSPIRGQLGIPMLGRGTFANCITIYFRADVRELLGERNLSVVYVNHPTLLGFFRFSITGDSGFLAVFVTSDADGGHRTTDIAADTSPERCTDYVRTALGCGPDLPIEIESVQAWNAEAGWAERFSQGRVLLAGDAAHVMPPTGGFGGNTGIADAHNLAWKLPLLLEGVAAPGLLETYDAERRPAAELTVEQAYTRYVLRVDTTLPQNDLVPPLDDASIELGIAYSSDALVASGSGDAPPLEDPRTPTGRPGVRLAHLPVSLDGRTISLHDVLGEGFVVLAASAGQAWIEAAATAAASVGVPVAAYRVGPDADLAADEGRFEDATGVTSYGAVLVRPDGIVGWREAEAADDPAGRLDEVLRRILGRDLT